MKEYEFANGQIIQCGQNGSYRNKIFSKHGTKISVERPLGGAFAMSLKSERGLVTGGISVKCD